MWCRQRATFSNNHLVFPSAVKNHQVPFDLLLRFIQAVAAKLSGCVRQQFHIRFPKYTAHRNLATVVVPHSVRSITAE
ncbi:hypothetical protein AHF37_05959 [Paragonimus kellicotti]|nr:hypothetical protein AHF37_05959 [Paragonimus kellicotti]